MKCKNCGITNSYVDGQCMICLHGLAESVLSDLMLDRGLGVRVSAKNLLEVDLEALEALLESYKDGVYLRFHSVRELLESTLRFNLWTKKGPQYDRFNF